MPAQLKNGGIGAPGGKRAGSGRKPDWFKKWIGNLVHSPKNRRRLERILSDAPDAEVYLDKEGKPSVKGRARADTYLRAYEFATHYDQGKPVARLDVGGGNGAGRLVFIFPNEEESK